MRRDFCRAAWKAVAAAARTLGQTGCEAQANGGGQYCRHKGSVFDVLSRRCHLVVVLTKVPSFPSSSSSSSPSSPASALSVHADPATPASLSLPSPPSSSALPDPSPDAITVLVVDDERSNIESLEKI